MSIIHLLFRSIENTDEAAQKLAAAVREQAQRTGYTGNLSDAIGRSYDRDKHLIPPRDRGRVLEVCAKATHLLDREN